MRKLLVVISLVLLCICLRAPSEARTRSTAHKSASHAAPKQATSKKRGSTGAARTSAAHTGKGVRVSSQSSRKTTVAGARHSRHHVVATHHGAHAQRVVHASHTHYAYPLNFFMMNSPEFDRRPLDRDASDTIARSFHSGFADQYAARSLVRAGIVSYHPLHGGIFWRREPIKYIIIHSTETGIPVSATNVINGWNSSGRRHPGAQYVVDRDGTIFQAVDPDLGTVHVNIFKTLPGINNDNSIGIEMNHTGRQDYPASERESVIKLVTYLQERYKVPDENVVTHRYAQQGDHTDPVNFDWEGFLATKNNFKNRAIAYKVKKMKDEVKEWKAPVAAADNENEETAQPEPTTYLQPHKAIQIETIETTTTTTTTTLPTNPSSGASSSATSPLPGAPLPTVPGAKFVVPPLRGPIELDPQSAPGLNVLPSQPDKDETGM